MGQACIKSPKCVRHGQPRVGAFTAFNMLLFCLCCCCPARGWWGCSELSDSWPVSGSVSVYRALSLWDYCCVLCLPHNPSFLPRSNTELCSSAAEICHGSYNSLGCGEAGLWAAARLSLQCWPLHLEGDTEVDASCTSQDEPMTKFQTQQSWRLGNSRSRPSFCCRAWILLRPREKNTWAERVGPEMGGDAGSEPQLTARSPHAPWHGTVTQSVQNPLGGAVCFRCST